MATISEQDKLIILDHMEALNQLMSILNPLVQEGSLSYEEAMKIVGAFQKSLQMMSTREQLLHYLQDITAKAPVILPLYNWYVNRLLGS